VLKALSKALRCIQKGDEMGKEYGELEKGKKERGRKK